MAQPQPQLFTHCPRCNRTTRQHANAVPSCTKCKQPSCNTITLNTHATMFLRVNVQEAQR
jgi:hypothetical protein